MIKVFISQPMNGLSPEQIQTKRDQVTEKLDDLFGKGKVEVLDTYFKDADSTVPPLWYLGESIKRMAEADVVYFCHGWSHARGCIIENRCAKAYRISVIEEED